MLHGSAGTGKTALLPEPIDGATRRGLRPEPFSPSGQGARRLEERIGQTGDTVYFRIYRYARPQVHDAEHVPPRVRFRLRRPLGIPRLVVVVEAVLIGDLPNEDTVPRDPFLAGMAAQRPARVGAGPSRQPGGVDRGRLAAAAGR